MAKPLPPPPAGQQRPPAPNMPAAVKSAPAKEFSVSSGRQQSAQRIVIFGDGGLGKTTLAALAPNPVFLDVENGTTSMAVNRIPEISTFDDLRAVIGSDILDPFDTIVIDSGTRAEELAKDHMLLTVPHEKGGFPTSIEGYGYGKGYQYLFETFSLLLADCDNLIAKGKNVILIAHACISDVPNPTGDDFIRYEPHFQSPKSGKSSIRNRVVQWADHVFFIGLDIFAKDGKAKGGETRTIYTTGRADHVAKHRQLPVDLPASIPFTSPEDDTLWRYVFQEVNSNEDA